MASALIRAICRHESFFTDYGRVCDATCLRYDCEACATRLSQVAKVLVRSDSLYWEVWTLDVEAPRLCGLLYLSDILPGCEALAHYVFFDGRLKDKTDLLEAMIEWCFTDRPDWKALRRLTVEVPAFATALATHATKRLGFGGPYMYGKIPVEGARRNALRYHGEDHDVLILGRLNNG